MLVAASITICIETYLGFWLNFGTDVRPEATQIFLKLALLTDRIVL
jgi:hypothetical protein